MMTGYKIVKDFSLAKIAIGLMFALVILPSNIKALAILFFGLTMLVFIKRRKLKFNRTFFLTNALFYIFLVLTLFYSENKDEAINKLLIMSSLLVFPFIFSFFLNKEAMNLFKSQRTFLWIYVVSVFLFNIVPFLWFYLTHYTFKEILIHYPAVIMTDMGKYNIHPIYLSMHNSIAILFSFFIYKKTSNSLQKIVLLIMVIICFVFLLYFSKKGPILSLIIGSIFLLFLEHNKKYFRYKIIALVVLLCLMFIIPKVRNNFLELFKVEVLSNKEKVTSTNMRYTIYLEAKDIILRSPIIGHGIGDVKSELKQSYGKKNYTVLYSGNYNSHNQYISILLSGGIITLFVFMFMILKNIILAKKTKNYIFLVVVIFYGIEMLTENILERENGIIFFSLFFNFFALKSFYEVEKE